MSKLLQISAGVAVLASAGFVLPASAAVRHVERHGRMLHRVRHVTHRRIVHRIRHRIVEHRIEARPLTVTRRYRSPYHGPAAIITGPVTIAGTIVGLPFRALRTVFPAHGNPTVDPLVLIGAPIHVAGKLAQLPFYVVDTAFGVSPAYD
ncbi:MAG TPA: hypothetical protein VND97_08310 [Beijerinckiaceae bacterium]|nr:hypothetical protein [Beijerinckiaceae bacterium]